VTAALIAAALETAKRAGAHAVEAYPLDASLSRSSTSTELDEHGLCFHILPRWFQAGRS
jgi:hypothetical protein